MENKKHKKKRVFLKIIFVFSLLACFFVLSVHSFADSVIQYANNGSIAYSFTPVFHANAFFQGYNTYGQSSLVNRYAASFDDMYASAFAPSQDDLSTVYFHYTTAAAMKDVAILQLEGDNRVGLSKFNYLSQVTYTSRLQYNTSISSGEWFTLPRFIYPVQFVRLADWDVSVSRGMEITFESSDTVNPYDAPWRYHLEVLSPNPSQGQPFDWVTVPLGDITDFWWRNSSAPASDFDTYKTAYSLPYRSVLQSESANNAWDVLADAAHNGVVCIRGSLECSASDLSKYRFGSLISSSYGSTSRNWSEYFSRWYMDDSIELVEVPIGNNWLDWIVKSASAFLDTPLFGSFSIGSLLLVVLGIAIFNLFVHMFKG